MPIRVLPPEVAAGIAAGEVIERPASIVKELIENSIDARATAIDLSIRQGGLQSIRIADDGMGIPASELAIAIQRHSTSKLQTLDGLERISTLGFRGEALASVVAAAHLRMSSRPHDAPSAAFIEAEGAAIIGRGTEGGPPGTTVEVSALFSTIPARLKFIRSAAAETSRIHQVVDHMALANPGVRLTLRAEPKTLLQTSGNGVLRDVVAQVHGTAAAEEMIQVSASERGVYPVSGLVSPPERSRSNRTGIAIFVNGRWINSRALSIAVEESYRGLLMEGRYPYAVLFLEVPGADIDVNVHPNKREVRFVREGDAFSSVQRAVREALLAAFPVAAATGLLPPVPPLSNGRLTSPPSAFDFTLAPERGAWAPLPVPDAAPNDEPGGAPSQPLEHASGMPELRVLGQVARAYLVAEGPDGLYLIDQHAAHESVLYYRLLHQWEEQSPEVQPLLQPLPIELTHEQVEVVEVARETLDRYGLTLEPFGPTTWLIRTVPAMARQVDAGRLVAEVLDVERNGGGLTDTHAAVAASIACHSAVRAGQSLDQQEMNALSHALSAEANPQHCPHGRPTTVRVTISMLDHQFGRA